MDDRKKPDGSLHDTQLAAISDRNDAARKIARAQRAKREESQDRQLRKSEAKVSDSLRKQSIKAGGAAAKR